MIARDNSDKVAQRLLTKIVAKQAVTGAFAPWEPSPNSEKFMYGIFTGISLCGTAKLLVLGFERGFTCLILLPGKNSEGTYCYLWSLLLIFLLWNAGSVWFFYQDDFKPQIALRDSQKIDFRPQDGWRSLSDGSFKARSAWNDLIFKSLLKNSLRRQRRRSAGSASGNRAESGLMNRLILIRHAQSEHHVKGLTGGWTDTPLTAFGNAQALALAERCRRLFADAPDLRLYSSDLLRASQTAERIAAAMGTEIHLEPGLREINNGIAKDLTWREADKIELSKTEPALHWIPYPEAESEGMMRQRVHAAMEQIDASCPSVAMVVTHGIAAGAVISWWLRLQAQGCVGIAFELDAASLSEFGINTRQERTIIRLNDTAHLEDFPLT